MSTATGRSLRGERGLKYLLRQRQILIFARRSLRGERGLKSPLHKQTRCDTYVAPYAGSVD